MSNDALINGAMLEALLCPVTRGPLVYEAKTQELISKKANLAYPIRNGIPIMLESEARDLSAEN